MIHLISIIALGFFLGMRHATDPDHVIAITTIVTRQRNLTRAALTGVFWGIGHTLTILVVGTGIILFKLAVSPRLGLSMELSVGLMLVVLGLMNLVSFFRAVPKGLIQVDDEPEAAHEHTHNRDDDVCSHPRADLRQSDSQRHEHEPLIALDRAFGKIGVYQNIRPLVVGVVHGLAGSAAVALLVLTTISNSQWAVVYLLVFGVGTIAGMMLITMSVASAFRYVGVRSEVFGRRLGLAAGLVSLAFGLFLAYQIGFANGLFVGHPHWIPR